MLTINSHLYTMNFDPLKDLTPITIMATGAEVLVVRPELGNRICPLARDCKKRGHKS